MPPEPEVIKELTGFEYDCLLIAGKKTVCVEIACCLVMLVNRWPANTAVRYVTGVTGFKVIKSESLKDFGLKIGYKEVKPFACTNLMHNTYLNS